MCRCLLQPWLEKVYRGIYFTKFIRVYNKLMISCPDYVIIAINHMIIVLERQSPNDSGNICKTRIHCSSSVF